MQPQLLCCAAQCDAYSHAHSFTCSLNHSQSPPHYPSSHHVLVEGVLELLGLLLGHLATRKVKHFLAQKLTHTHAHTHSYTDGEPGREEHSWEHVGGERRGGRVTKEMRQAVAREGVERGETGGELPELSNDSMCYQASDVFCTPTGTSITAHQLSTTAVLDVRKS